MNYIDNITLAILLELYRSRSLRLNVSDAQSIEQVCAYFYGIELTIKNKPDNLSPEQDEEFEENYEPCFHWQVQPTSIVLTCKDTKHLANYLKQYIKLYKSGELIEYGNRNEYDSIAALSQELKMIAESSSKPIARFIITDTKFTPLIADKYLRNNDFIRGMQIKSVPSELVEYPIHVYDINESGDIDAMLHQWSEYIDVRYELDLNWYLEKFNDEDINADKIKGYTNTQKKMLEVIEKLVRFENTKDEIDRKYEIPADVFMSRTHIGQSKINMAVSRLNERYREISDAYENIISKDKKSGCYVISQEYIESIINNG